MHELLIWIPEARALKVEPWLWKSSSRADKLGLGVGPGSGAMGHVPAACGCKPRLHVSPWKSNADHPPLEIWKLLVFKILPTTYFPNS